MWNHWLLLWIPLPASTSYCHGGFWNSLICSRIVRVDSVTLTCIQTKWFPSIGNIKYFHFWLTNGIQGFRNTWNVWRRYVFHCIYCTCLRLSSEFTPIVKFPLNSFLFQLTADSCCPGAPESEITLEWWWWLGPFCVQPQAHTIQIGALKLCDAIVIKFNLIPINFMRRPIIKSEDRLVDALCVTLGPRNWQQAYISLKQDITGVICTFWGPQIA